MYNFTNIAGEKISCDIVFLSEKSAKICEIFFEFFEIDEIIHYIIIYYSFDSIHPLMHARFTMKNLESMNAQNMRMRGLDLKDLLVSMGAGEVPPAQEGFNFKT